MFNKLVVIEPVNLTKKCKEELKNYAKEVILYDDIPGSPEEIISRAKDADAMLVSYTSYIGSDVLEACINLKYVGMCCSLYAEESANVDIAYAREHGITVKGVRDYGDRGVVEYVLYQLIQIMHGFGDIAWDNAPIELTKLPVGIVGLGTSGGMIAEALNNLGACVSYYSRTRKPEQESKGISYMPLPELLNNNQVVITCLNKNVLLLKEEEFKQLGNKKILFNTSIGPSFENEPLAKWLECSDNIFCCDSLGALGEMANELFDKPNVLCMNVSSGTTKQAFGLLSQKVINNITEFQASAK